MGRCNNRRVQQQAQESRGVPARARFSQRPQPATTRRRPPPPRRGGDGNHGAASGGGGAPSSSSSSSSDLASRVVASRTARQQQNHRNRRPHDPAGAFSSASAGGGGGGGGFWRPYPGGNVAGLDAIELSDESVERIYRLLASLGVIQGGGADDGESGSDEEGDDDDNDEPGARGDSGGCSDDEDEDGDGADGDSCDGPEAVPSSEGAPATGAPAAAAAAAAVVGEYDDDCDEADLAVGGAAAAAAAAARSHAGAEEWRDADWEGAATAAATANKGAGAAAAKKTTNDRNREFRGANVSDLGNDEVDESDPAYRYLTSHLSFPGGEARRALRAVERGWKGGGGGGGGIGASSSSPSAAVSPPVPSPAAWKDRLGLALDWLALHLSDAEITAGFRRQRRGRDGSAALPFGAAAVMAVPHPSVSVATRLTDDAEFLRRARVDERAAGFVQLGFAYSDVAEAILQQEGEGAPALALAAPAAGAAIDDEATLRRLLSKLEQDVYRDAGASRQPARVVDNTEALMSDRREEVEVLSAVYEADFVVMQESRDELMGRYKITLSESATDALLAAAPSDRGAAAGPAAELHAFLRPGYPEVEPPLFLVSCPGADGPLLRRVNAAVVRRAAADAAYGGGPCVYDVAAFLAESLEEIAAGYREERRRAGGEGDEGRRDVWPRDGDDERGGGTKAGRRGAARIKGDERAHDFQQRQEARECERREQQAARLERIEEQDRFIRQSRADEELDRRERRRHEEGARKASRAAMLSALNGGAAPDEARARAESAELSYKIAHGLADPVESGANDVGLAVPVENGDASGAARDDDPIHGKDKASGAASAPRTQAFMERLRALYGSAAEQKGIVRLETHDLQGTSGTRLPRPIALPVGDLAGVINDVVSVQQEQPWLVHDAEARVPTLEEATESAPGRGNREPTDPDALSMSLKREMEDKLSSKRYGSILKHRRKLPAYKVREELVRTISSNQVTVVSGETGCGKSICTPQFVLDDMILRNVGSHANIIVTQPRRISAVGVSERIAYERLESVGDTCGYSIKLERKASSRTRLLFCTTGILLRRLQCDPDLASVSHVFVDEVHERDLNTDFILIILKELLKRRPSLKLVLMSATLNAESFVRYFPGSATLSIPGRSHPVREYRLEDALQHTGFEVSENSDYAKKKSAGKGDGLTKKELRKLYPNYHSTVIDSLHAVDETVINYELLAQLLLYIVENEGDGAVLVFLPGIMEISKAMDEIRRIEKFQSSAFRIYPLHSSLSTADQVSVFEVPPEGVRKIVLASNIAETSITIEDVVFVVDAGRVKENRRDEVKETPALVECWVSRASAKQRRGRAGRVRPGIAYHLFSSHTHNHVLQEHQLPEILRVGLEDIVLRILTLDLGEPSKFLASAIDPPSALAMKNALRLLESLGAVECAWTSPHLLTDKTSAALGNSPCGELDASTELTALGFHLSSLPVDPRIGKMMIYGALFGCVDSALTIAAAMTCTKPLFAAPFDQRDAANEARVSMSVEGSDHLTLLGAFNEWKHLRKVKGAKSAQIFANNNFLSRTTLFQMEDLRRHYAGLLAEIGFLPKGFKLANAGHHSATPGDTGPGSRALLRALLCAGLYPNVIVCPRSLVAGPGQETAGDVTFRSQSKGDVYLHPCTVSFSAKKLSSRYFCFYEIVRTSKLFVRDLTAVNPLALLLFGGAIEDYPREGVITIDDWLRFRVTSKPARSDCVPARRIALIKHLRFQLESMLLRKIVSPASNDTDSGPIIDAITGLLREEDPNVFQSEELEMIPPFNLAPAQASDSPGRPVGYHSDRRGRSRGRGRSNGSDNKRTS